MNGQDLKNSILQLAIQGKLVEQKKEEGLGKELLRQIREEKEELIKAKKIKKEKPLPEITEDERPFDNPESWEWVRLGELITYKNGYAYKSSDMNSIQKGYPVIKSGSIMSLKVVINSKTDYIENPTEKMLDSLIVKNDMLMCLSSQSNNPEPLGKTAIYELYEPALLNQRVLKMKALLEELTKYLYYTINSHYFHYNVSHQGGGSAQANLKLDHVLYMLIPLPPLEEQKRIVAKIEKLMPYVEKYDKAYSEVEQLNKKFPEDMKKSILQYAIQGKLIEQREEDGTAKELYRQIQEEKKKMIEEGKINKQKLLAEITEDEIPFEIPGSWKWVRLEDICEYIQRGKSPKYSDIKKYPVIAQKCNQWSGFSIDKAKFIDPKTITSYNEERFLVDGDLMWNSTGLGTLGRIAIYEDCKNPYELAVADSHVTVIRPLNVYLNYKYLYYYFANPTVQNVIEEQSDGSTKQKELSTNTVKNYIVPLPPLEEQKRIVAKIEELLPYTKQLVKE